MKVKVIDDNCISCGACQAICDDVFEIDEISKVKVDVVPEELEDLVVDAIESCPTEAIVRVED